MDKKGLLDKVKQLFSGGSNREHFVSDGSEYLTHDKSLVSLRKLRRKQLDEMERERLKETISKHNSARERIFTEKPDYFKSTSKKKSKDSFLGFGGLL